MNYVKNYILYVKDNPKGLWFKRKLYGWGWTPVKWQGWLVIFGFILFIVWNGSELASIQASTDAKLSWFFIKIVASVLVLILICYKTGERPRWQWGIPIKK